MKKKKYRKCPALNCPLLVKRAPVRRWVLAHWDQYEVVGAPDGAGANVGRVSVGAGVLVNLPRAGEPPDAAVACGFLFN